MNVCHVCGIPWDADFFDESQIVAAPGPGDEVILASYQLARNYCGVLMYFAQYAVDLRNNPIQGSTPGYQWQIRCNGQPRDPYLGFEHIINSWGISGFPVHLRLEESCNVEIAVRKVGPGPGQLSEVGGRILGRYWYNTAYGGAPGRL